jgi:hypothetical protein
MNMKEDAKGFIQDVVTMEDVVLGKSLAKGGLRQFFRLGTSISGPSVVLNIGTRFAFMGAQVAAKTAAFSTRGRAREMSSRMADIAHKAGSRCSELAIRGIEMSGGRAAVNPLTDEEWLSKKVPLGYNARALVADSTFGTMEAVSYGTVSALLNGIRMVLGNMEESSKGSYGGVLLDSEFDLIRSCSEMAAAVGRLSLGDTRSIEQEMGRALKAAEMIVKEGEMPSWGFSERVRDAAQQVLDQAPNRFLTAIRRNEDGVYPSPRALFNVTVRDTRTLITFFGAYSQMVSMLGAELLDLLSEDKPEVTLERLIGMAKTDDDCYPLFSKSAVQLASDLFFVREGSDCRTHGLSKVEEVFGKRSRGDIERDVSLVPQLLHVAVADRDDTIRSLIESFDSNALQNRLERAGERLPLLEDSQITSALLPKQSLGGRIEVLRRFMAIGGVALGRRSAPECGEDRSESEKALLGLTEDIPSK